MSRLKILIVDDEPQIVNSIAALLETNGYETITATSGKEGLEKVKKYKPNLILLDILMPEMDAGNMVSQIRHIPDISNTPVIFLTCLAGEMGKENLTPTKGYTFIAKPFDPEELLEIIKKTIREN
jgi:CheY-like chemotaxis protein